MNGTSFLVSSVIGFSLIDRPGVKMERALTYPKNPLTSETVVGGLSFLRGFIRPSSGLMLFSVSLRPTYLTDLLH